MTSLLRLRTVPTFVTNNNNNNNKKNDGNLEGKSAVDALQHGALAACILICMTVRKGKNETCRAS